MFRSIAVLCNEDAHRDSRAWTVKYIIRKWNWITQFVTEDMVRQNHIVKSLQFIKHLEKKHRSCRRGSSYQDL
jgi:hypothetical protein